VVASVPTGTGMIILANDEVQIHDNRIHDNASTGIAITGYDTLPFPAPTDPEFDHFPETLYIHDNVFTNNGYQPMDILTLPMVTPLKTR
jgi:hypothetical protein